MKDHFEGCKKGEELLLMVDFTFMHSIAMLIFSKYMHTYYLLQFPYNSLKVSETSIFSLCLERETESQKIY